MSTIFKKATYSLLALTITSSTTYAALLPATTVVNHNINGAFVGIDGLFLQPGNNDLDYNIIFPNSTTAPVSTQAISPDYSWGFNLYGGVNFGQNDDVTIGWTSLHTSDSDTVGNLASVASLNPRWIGNASWVGVKGSADFDYDDVSAVLGHTFYFNNPWTARFAGGLEYARLNNNFNVIETLSPALGGGTYGYKNNSEFNGVGPRIEGDITYRLPYNFAVFADTNAALLIGRRNLSLTSIDPTTTASYVFSNRNVVVPSLGMKLGVGYTFYFGHTRTVGAVGGEGAVTRVTDPTTAVNLAAGWQATSLINAVEDPNCIAFNDDGAGSGNGVGSCTTLTNTITNYTNQGPFIGIKVTSKGM